MTTGYSSVNSSAVQKQLYWENFYTNIVILLRINLKNYEVFVYLHRDSLMFQ